MVSRLAELLCFRNDTNPTYEDPITDGKEGQYQDPAVLCILEDRAFRLALTTGPPQTLPRGQRIISSYGI